MALIYGLFKYRERQLIKEKRILEHKVKLRTKEIEDQKVEIEAQRDEISGQKKFVEEQRDQIALQNKEITDSILYAKRIQQAVLPGKKTLEKTCPNTLFSSSPGTLSAETSTGWRKMRSGSSSVQPIVPGTAYRVPS